MTDELFSRNVSVPEDTRSLALACGITPTRTSTLLLQRKEQPAAACSGFEFGCRMMQVDQFLRQLDEDEVRGRQHQQQHQQQAPRS